MIYKILIILSLIIIIILTILLVLMRKKLINSSNEDNDAVLKILEKISEDTTNYVDSSARHIIDVMKKYYKIDYFTILIKDGNKLNIIATDVEDTYKKDIETYCEELLSAKGNKAALISKAEGSYLEYSTARKRRIGYSYFIALDDIGAIFIENFEEYEANNFEIKFFKVIIKNISIILKNCVYQDKLSILAMRDNLTGAYNRNYMNENLNKIMSRNDNLVVAIMDIDHFKMVNDTYGHSFGDYVLINISKFIKGNLSQNDEIYRWGGEEFILTFLNKDIKQVESELNHIRSLISELELNDGVTSTRITVSFGVTTYLDGDSIDKVIKKADKGLYTSKETGRNKVTVYLE